MRWPIGIAVFLGVVVIVNLAFLWVAVANSPEIEPSYVTTPR